VEEICIEPPHLDSVVDCSSSSWRKKMSRRRSSVFSGDDDEEPPSRLFLRENDGDRGDANSRKVAMLRY
jgi:hypothetical protein